MYFTSATFVAFLALVLVGYYLVFRRFQWQFLLVASFVFYAFSGWENLIYISVTIVSTWYAGRRMNALQAAQIETLAQNKAALSTTDAKAIRAATKQKRKRWLVACLLFNFGILAVVKYSNFAIGNINSLLDLLGANGRLGLLGLALPMGISFYTFQTMGYIIDVYRSKKADAAEGNLFRLALFSSFFPQIIQGPISRFGELSKTLYGPHRFNSDAFSAGLLRVLWGFFKKLIIADRLLVAVKTLTAAPAEYGGVYVLLAMSFYAITLYADFTGGIDITIGTAQMLGIKLPENFNRPFYSMSIAEYWRRWHITMGTWFKDYLFYPLSTAKPMLALIKPSRKLFGEKIGVRVPVYLVTIILWFATGLWHGASWNFIVWGLANGVVIIVSQELAPAYKRFHNRFTFANTAGYNAFQILRTFWLMCFIRSFDIYASVGATFAAYASVFTRFGAGQFAATGLSTLGLATADYIIAAAGVLAMIIAGAVKARFYTEKPVPMPLRFAGYFFLFFAVLIFGRYGIGYDANQFIYNQF